MIPHAAITHCMMQPRRVTVQGATGRWTAHFSAWPGIAAASAVVRDQAPGHNARTHARDLEAPPTALSLAFGRSMFDLINEARRQAGRTAVTWSATLAAVAQWRSLDMARRHYLSHRIPGGPGDGLLDAVLDRDRIRYRAAAENIGSACGTSTAQAIRGIYAGFMASPEHRENMLDGEYTQVGIAVATDRSRQRLLVTVILTG